MVRRPASALVDAIVERGDLKDYRLLHAARADLCRRLGRADEARDSYARALALTRQEPERRFLQRRLAELQSASYARPRGRLMKYLCLVYLESEKMRAVLTPSAWHAANGLRERGVLVAAEALQPVDTATTVRVRGGRATITDGPFAETKEQLAGFYLIDAQNLDEALEVAAKIPPAREGSVEVRPVRQLDA